MLKNLDKVVLFFFLLTHSTVTAQPSADQELDAYFNKLEKKDKAMGSFSILKDGEIVYTSSFGFADLQGNKKADANTVYQIGSVSKLITAALVLMAVEEGKLMLDGKLELYFPQIPNAEKITVEHLLRHQSGIHNFGEDNSYRTINPQSDQEIIEVMAAAEGDFKPGARTEYNNANYLLLSLMLQEVYQKKFAVLLQEKITVPLQLKNLYYGNNTDKQEQEALSYYWRNGWKLNYQKGSTDLYGAGGIKATPSDLNLFLSALFTGKLITKETLKLMLDFEENIGLGIFRYPFYNKICYGHAGSIGTFKSMAAYFPEEGVAFAITLNGERESMNEIIKEALSIYFNVTSK